MNEFIKREGLNVGGRGVASRRTEEVKEVRELNIKMKERRQGERRQEDGHAERLWGGNWNWERRNKL